MTTEKFFVGSSPDKKLADHALSSLSNEPEFAGLVFSYSEKDSSFHIQCEAKPEFKKPSFIEHFIEADMINARAYFRGFYLAWWLSKG